MSVLYNNVQMDQETAKNSFFSHTDAVTIKISMSEYHLLINRQTYMVYSNTTVYGGKWVWYMRSLVYFHFFGALNDAFQVQVFSGLDLCTISKTLIACTCRAMQLRFFFKVETLLNNAFNT